MTINRTKTQIKSKQKENRDQPRRLAPVFVSPAAIVRVSSGSLRSKRTLRRYQAELIIRVPAPFGRQVQDQRVMEVVDVVFVQPLQLIVAQMLGERLKALDAEEAEHAR